MGFFWVLGSSDYRWTTATTPDNDKYHQQWPVQSAACVWMRIKIAARPIENLTFDLKIGSARLVTFRWRRPQMQICAASACRGRKGIKGVCVSVGSIRAALSSVRSVVPRPRLSCSRRGQQLDCRVNPSTFTTRVISPRRVAEQEEEAEMALDGRGHLHSLIIWHSQTEIGRQIQIAR